MEGITRLDVSSQSDGPTGRRPKGMDTKPQTINWQTFEKSDETRPLQSVAKRGERHRQRIVDQDVVAAILVEAFPERIRERRVDRQPVVVGIPHDRPDVATNALRVAKVEDLQVELEALLADRKADDVIAELVEAGIPAGRIRTMPEVYDWEQVHHLGLVHHLAHTTLGDVAVPGGALRYDGTTAASTTPPPLLGEHEPSGWESWETPWLDQQEDVR